MKVMKNKWMLLLVIAVILVIVIALSSNPASPIHFIYKAVSVPLQPVQKFFAGTSGRVSDSFHYFFNYDEVQARIRQLEEDSVQLEKYKNNEELEYYKQQYEELKSLLDLANENVEYNHIAATVIANDTDNWYNLFVIDKGSNSGIQQYDCVVTSTGLVGKVISVSPTSAKVMSVVNEESTLMGRLSKTKDIVRVRGVDSRLSGITCKVDRIDEMTDIAVGDLIETAETGGIYPRGIEVGKIKEIVQEGTNRYAIIEPSANIRTLDIVMVMSKKGE